MKLKFIVTNLDEVPEAYRSLYKEEDGKFYLQVEGAVGKDKVDKFRDEATASKKELDALKLRFEDVDLDDYKRLKEKEDDLVKGKMNGKTIDEIVAERTAKMKESHDKEKIKLTERLTTADSELSRLKISDAAVTAAVKLGLRASAKDDLISRVTRTFTLENGVPIAKKADGTQLYDANSDPLSIEKHVETLVAEAPHLFEPNSGTGTNKSDTSKGGFTGPNPWDPKTINRTKQTEVIKANPGLAKRMAAEHGASIPSLA